MSMLMIQLHASDGAALYTPHHIASYERHRLRFAKALPGSPVHHCAVVTSRTNHLCRSIWRSMNLHKNGRTTGGGRDPSAWLAEYLWSRFVWESDVTESAATVTRSSLELDAYTLPL